MGLSSCYEAPGFGYESSKVLHTHQRRLLTNYWPMPQKARVLDPHGHGHNHNHMHMVSMGQRLGYGQLVHANLQAAVDETGN